MFEKTTLFNIDEIQDALIETTLDEVATALKQKGYNPASQIVGYLITGDDSFITSSKNARGKIKSIEREKILEVIVRSYLEN